MKKLNVIFIALTLGAASMAAASEIKVTLPEVAKTLAAVQPGDEILISSGTYKDVELKWKAPGFPLTIKTENPGTVVITGKSSLKLCGDSLTVEGLHFSQAHPEKGNVMEFRLGKELARACRLTQCVFENCNPDRRDQVSSYIVLHGQNNRVDHCSLIGKLNLGVTLLVNLNNAGSLNNHHLIDNNYFGHRPVYGSNGAETMRIGTSQQSYETSATVVKENFFEQCNGEVEIISVKSSDNIICDNVFYECEGVVALRHGKRNTVTGNIFQGNSKRNTGGVRIVDSGHIVENNSFCNLAGKRFFSALAIMNSVPNSLPNRYVQVSDVKVTDNTFINCTNIEFGTGKDEERTEAAKDCIFSNNVIMTDQPSPYTWIDDKAGVEFINNKIMPVKESAEKEIQAKCRQLRQLCGASYGSSSTSATVADTITLESGVVYRDKPYIINRPTIVKGNGTTLRWKGSSGDNFFTICNGGSLEIQGVTFDGALQQGYSVLKNAIATDPKMITTYTLDVKDCNFINMPESGCCAIKGMKGTFAEWIKISDCSFSDLSGNAISLADETDDKGRYSADDIIISSCKFSHMLGIPVNIYRGGSDESTAGPYVTITDCEFDDCCNRERGSVLRLIGPQKLTVEDCRFNDSGRGGYSIRLDETTWEDVAVSNCVFNNSGKILSNRNVVK